MLGSIWNTVYSIGHCATQGRYCLGKSAKAVTKINILSVKIREDLVKQIHIYPFLCTRLKIRRNLKNGEIEMDNLELHRKSDKDLE